MNTQFTNPLHSAMCVKSCNYSMTYKVSGFCRLGKSQFWEIGMPRFVKKFFQ